MSEAKIGRALTISNVIAKVHPVYPFEQEWKDFLNQPENRGVWFIWGNSGSGKSSFVMQLAKYLAQFERVLYNALEEYQAKSFKDRMLLLGMQEVKGNFLVAKYSLQELIAVLKRRKSPQVVIIDSEKYMKWTFNEFTELVEMFPTKTFIIIGQAKGKNPKTGTANDIMFDAYIKIWVQGYMAFSKGREIGPNGGVFTIWKEGADKYWGNQI